MLRDVVPGPEHRMGVERQRAASKRTWVVPDVCQSAESYGDQEGCENCRAGKLVNSGTENCRKRREG